MNIYIECDLHWATYAKAEKDKTQKQSQRMKNNLNRCVLAF